MESEIEQIFVKPEFALDINEESCHTAENNENALEDPESEASESDLDNVKKVRTDGKKTRLQCPKCDKTLQNLSILKRHLRTVHLKESENIECNQCFRTFKSKEFLWSHMHAMHKNIKDAPCPQCGKVFINKRRLDNHIYYTHTDLDPVQCTECEKIFKGQRKLKIHMKNVHTFEENVTCPHCDKTFKMKTLLTKHIAYHHTEEDMEYKCPCETVFTSHARYKCHMKNVHPVKRPQCMLCHKVLKLMSIARKHVKACHQIKDSVDNYITYEDVSIKLEMPELITCKICFKEFDSQKLYKRHLRTTHPPKEAEASCDICHKTFKSNLHVQIHRTNVHSDVTFKCDECGKDFATKRYLTKHKLTHTKEMSICDICDNWYTSKINLLDHKRKAHKQSVFI